MSAFSLLVLALQAPSFAGAKVSSYRTNNRAGGEIYNAQSAIDGNFATAWQLPGDSNNVGEWILIDVPKSTLDKVGCVIGWQEDEKRFFDYARVKTLEVDVMAYDENNELKPAGTRTVSFEDKLGWQVVDIEDIAIGTEFFGGKVRLTIKEIYPGKDFPNVAISEVLLHMAELHSPKPTIVAISSEEGANTQGNLVDENDKTFWVGRTEGASITLQADGFSLSRVGFKAVSKEYDRPARVRVTVKGRSEEVAVPDSLDMQWVNIPAAIGFTGGGWGEVQLEILETHPGTKYPGKIGLRTLQTKATAFDG